MDLVLRIRFARLIKLPGADLSGIKMYKIGFWIVTYSAGLQFDAQISQPMRAVAGQTDIDGLAPGVITGLGHTFGFASEHGIGGW